MAVVPRREAAAGPAGRTLLSPSEEAVELRSLAKQEKTVARIGRVEVSVVERDIHLQLTKLVTLVQLPTPIKGVVLDQEALRNMPVGDHALVSIFPTDRRWEDKFQHITRLLLVVLHTTQP